MQCYQLPTISIDGIPVQLDERHHALIIQGRRLYLRPQGFFLVRALVLQYQACKAGQRPDCLVSHAELCEETEAPDNRALRAVVSEARQELRHCLLILSEYGRGYFIRGAGLVS